MYLHWASLKVAFNLYYNYRVFFSTEWSYIYSPTSSDSDIIISLLRKYNRDFLEINTDGASSLKHLKAGDQLRKFFL